MWTESGGRHNLLGRNEGEKMTIQKSFYLYTLNVWTQLIKSCFNLDQKVKGT